MIDIPAFGLTQNAPLLQQSKTYTQHFAAFAKGISVLISDITPFNPLIATFNLSFNRLSRGIKPDY